MALDRNAADRRRFARLLGVDGAQGSGLPVRARRRRRSAAVGSSSGSSTGRSDGTGTAGHRDDPSQTTADEKVDGNRHSGVRPDHDLGPDTGPDGDRDSEREGTRSISSRLVLRGTR